MVKKAPLEEVADIQQRVCQWLNTCPLLPVAPVRVEPMLEQKVTGMVLVTVDGRLISEDILGGHTGQYQFALQYRVRPGASLPGRTKAVTELNLVGAWLTQNLPDLGENVIATKCEVQKQADLQTPYDNGDEDLETLLQLDYEVI